MRSLLLLTMLCVPLGACTGSNARPDDKTTTPAVKMNYPETRRQDTRDTVHGVEIADPYRWLEDASAEEVQQWMTAQDAFTTSQLSALEGREALEKRFAELFYVDSVSAPRRKGDRFFLYRRSRDKEKSVVYWKQGEDGEEKVLLDPNTMSEDGSVSLGGIFPSHDGKTVAYKLKANNADEATLYLLDVDTMKVSETDVIPGVNYSGISWKPDGSGFYYTFLPNDPAIPAQERPGYAEVRYHEVGKDPKTDVVIQPKTGDPKVFIGSYLSRDGKYLFLYKQFGWNASNVYYRPTDGSKGQAFLPLTENSGAQYSFTAYKDHFYVSTNHDAPNWKVLKVPAADPDLSKATVVIPEQADAVLDNVQIIGGKLVLTYMKQAHNQLKVHELDGSFLRDVALPSIGSTGGMTGDPDHDDAYFMFSSFTTPWQIYKTKISTGASSLYAKIDVPIDPSPYKVDQVFYDSKDGTKVSMFLVHRKDIPMDGSTPFQLYGYGGFNVSLKPSFRSSIYPWLEAGGGYAVANLRGGGEYGEKWHKDGMLLKKQNVFDDFIAAAEFLVQSKYTRPDKLAISGGSNGGLLVGAAMTQRPDLFGAVVCSVPLLDMVRYHLSGRGKTWIPEYGSAEDPEQFKALHAYSPYHNVREGVAYPATLFQSADSDDRVDPLHARKMAAALQHANNGPNPILLRIEKNAGHGGGDMTSKWVKKYAETQAFLQKALKF